MAGPPAPYSPGSGRPFGGWSPPAVPKWQTRTGTAMGAMMWLWIFYRAKNDLPHMLVRGWRDAVRWGRVRVREPEGEGA